jgi:hypothetical protein
MAGQRRRTRRRKTNDTGSDHEDLHEKISKLCPGTGFVFLSDMEMPWWAEQNPMLSRGVKGQEPKDDV